MAKILKRVCKYLSYQSVCVSSFKNSTDILSSMSFNKSFHYLNNEEDIKNHIFESQLDRYYYITIE